MTKKFEKPGIGFGGIGEPMIQVYKPDWVGAPEISRDKDGVWFRLKNGRKYVPISAIEAYEKAQKKRSGLYDKEG